LQGCFDRGNAEYRPGRKLIVAMKLTKKIKA